MLKMLGVAFFYAKSRGGCIFKEQNLEGVAKFRAILRGGLHFKKNHTHSYKLKKVKQISAVS